MPFLSFSCKFCISINLIALFFFLKVNTLKNPPNIAVVTSGALRSFAFTYKSWKTYILNEPQKYNIKIFAHIFHDTLSCPIAKLGLSQLKKIATSIEVGNMSTSFTSYGYNLIEKIPNRFIRYFPYLSRKNSTTQHLR